MALTNSQFKLSKTAKRALISIKDAHTRGAWKRALIAAQLAADPKTLFLRNKSDKPNK